MLSCMFVMMMVRRMTERYDNLIGEGHHCVALVFVVLLFSWNVNAEETSDGVALFERARFEDATHAFQRVLTNEGVTRSQLVEAHLYLAALALVSDDEERARSHARIAVVLEPGVSAPAGAPI